MTPPLSQENGLGKPNIANGKLVLIIGPSGVGKSAIVAKLRKKHPQLHFPRSATTRAKRQGEGDANYHFVTDEEFDELIHNHKFVETAVVHGGARYGTLVDEIIPFIKEGKTVVREIDVQGFNSIRQNALFRAPDMHNAMQSIFILPESKEQLVEHIIARAPLTDDELQRRIASMEMELSYAKDCDASITNREGQLDDTVQHVEALIFGK